MAFRAAGAEAIASFAWSPRTASAPIDEQLIDEYQKFRLDAPLCGPVPSEIMVPASASHATGTLPRSTRRLPCATALCFVLGALACTTSDRAETQPSTADAATAAVPTGKPAVIAPTLTETAPRDYPGIHNAVAFHEGYISGSVPEGDDGFASLAAMGVRTIISVDGAEPDIARAKAHGLRYIHLPIGYNGFDEERKLQLVRASRDALAEGPVYIHCHHGKHRSAGAAATVTTSLGWSNPDEGVARMRVSGTAPTYTGLYRCAAEARPLDAATIDAVPSDFPSVWKPSSFVQAMVDMDVIMEHLTAIEKAGWKAPTDHPDLVPVAEAGRLVDLHRVLLDGAYVKRKPEDFAALMRAGQDRAQALEDALAAGFTDQTLLGGHFKALKASCKDCHVSYRD